MNQQNKSNTGEARGVLTHDNALGAPRPKGGGERSAPSEAKGGAATRQPKGGRDGRATATEEASTARSAARGGRHRRRADGARTARAGAGEERSPAHAGAPTALNGGTWVLVGAPPPERAVGGGRGARRRS